MQQNPDGTWASEAFRRSRPGAEGYDVDEVDAFVHEVQAALAHTPPTMAPWEVRDKVFHTGRVHRGYDEHDVDDFLDRAEAALREAHGETIDDRPPSEGSATGAGGAIGGLLSRLRRQPRGR